MTKDPYKYFRIEAREIVDGLVQALIDIEKHAGEEAIDRLLRLAHTLKGAARVVKQVDIAAAAHGLEDAAVQMRGRLAPGATLDVEPLLRIVDGIAALVRAIDAPPAAPTAPAAPAGRAAAGAPIAEPALAAFRVERGDVDALLAQLGEVGAQLSVVERELARAPEARAAQAALARAQAELTTAREATQTLSLVPVRTLFPTLERAVRDAAITLDKSAELSARGGDVRLDGALLASMSDALLHVLRNAVAHGIEAADIRARSGKPRTGKVSLAVTREGGHVCFRCHDDGRGVDLAAVRRTALARGELSAHEADTAPPEALFRLLLRSGFSTSSGADEVSGRGVGLHAAARSVARHRGTIELASRPSEGTTITLRVPLSVAAVDVLEVEVAGRPMAVPLDAIESAFSVDEDDVVTTTGRTTVLHQGKALPFFELQAALGQRSTRAKAARRRPTLVVRGSTGNAAVGVDRLLGRSVFVVRPAPAVARVSSLVAGVALDHSGDPELVLEPDALVEAAAHHGLPPPSAVPERPSPILVIDDSLTTRMLEKSILESAGYDVELAASAEEALEKSRKKRFSVFVVDVEMPGMDGFGFLRAARSDPELAGVPGILVTSRAGPEDRARGKEAGAFGFVAKGDFDQGLLLDLIRKALAQ